MSEMTALSSGMQLKQRLILTTAALTAGGSAVACAMGGTDASLPFAIGGSAGRVGSLLCGFCYTHSTDFSLCARTAC